MSEISTAKAAALTLASNIVEKGTTAEATIQVANKFLAYITGETAPAGKPATPAPAAPAAKPAAPAAKPAAKKTAAKPTPPPEPPADESEPEGEAEIDYTSEAGKEQVGALVAQLIAANRRPEAVKLLSEYDSTSVSGVKPGEREAFCNEARELLAAGDITS